MSEPDRCPECGAATGAAYAARGYAFRCPSCASWLYRHLWDDRGRDSPCAACAAPADSESCGCILCGTGTAAPKTRSRGLIARFLGLWRGRSEGVRLLPIAGIRADTLEPRHSVGLHRFEALRRSLEEVGMIEPLLVRATGERGVHGVIDGHRRLLAARHLGWARVPARVIAVGDADAQRIRLAANLHREELSPLDLAEAFERSFLLAGRGSREEIAASLGIDERRLHELLRLLQVSPAEREELVHGGAVTE